MLTKIRVYLYFLWDRLYLCTRHCGCSAHSVQRSWQSWHHHPDESGIRSSWVRGRPSAKCSGKKEFMSTQNTIHIQLSVLISAGPRTQEDNEQGRVVSDSQDPRKGWSHQLQAARDRLTLTHRARSGPCPYRELVTATNSALAYFQSFHWEF